MSGAKCTDGPWCIPAGEGNELIVCAGDDPNHYGEILFVLHPPAGMKITMAYEDMASMARLCAAAPDLLAALQLHQAWSDSENAGPDYGGMTRDTHPDGEIIWRKWWNANCDLCGRAQDATRDAISRATGANHE